MAHFSEQVWADFVRGTGSSTRDMESHLAAGCPGCKGDLDLWRAVRSLANDEAMYAPPNNLVRRVKLEFASKHAVQTEEGTLASLIFDSTAQPLPAGVRSGAVTTRQFVYEAEGLTIDLRFERKPHSNSISASGQVLDKKTPLCWLGNATVVLWTDTGRMLTRTEANDYGEFQLEFESNDQLRLSIATTGRRTLRIPLGNLA